MYMCERRPATWRGGGILADGADERETIGVATKIVCNALSENKKATETEERKEKEKWQAANLKCKKGGKGRD